MRDYTAELGASTTAATYASIPYWWYDNVRYRAWTWRFSNGTWITGFGYPSAVYLQSGSADVDGTVGAGGFTDTDVSCNCVYDLVAPFTGTRGYLMDFIAAKNPRANSNGVYFAAMARFCTNAEQTLAVTLVRSTPNFEVTTYANVGFLKRTTHTNWQAARCDQSDWSYTDTGVAWSASDWHFFEVFYWDNAGTRQADYYIDGVLVASVTTGLPTSVDFDVRAFVGSNGLGGTSPQVLFVSQVHLNSYQNGELLTHF